MSDVLIPDSLLILLIFGFWISMTYLIGRSIRDEPDIAKKRCWIFYYFDFGDWIQFGFGIILLVPVLYFLHLALTGATLVGDLPNSDEKFRFMGIYMSFIGLGLTMFIMSANLLKEVYSAVTNRVRFNKINERFDVLDERIRRL
jgi:hypothetical protein